MKKLNNFVSKILIAFCLISSCINPTTEVFDLDHAKQLEEQGWEQVPKILSRIQSPTFIDVIFNVVDFGAKDDSTFNSQSSIQNAINHCHVQGGGQVLIPTGNYYSDGPIHLKSNVNLHLAAGANLFFSDNPEQYLPMVKVRWEGTVCWNYSPLIYAYQEENIGLTGKGTIDGRGLDWSKKWRSLQKPDKTRLRQMGNDLVPEDQRVFGDEKQGPDPNYGDSSQHYLRPTLIELYQCHNVLIENLTIRASPFWTVHPVFSKNITIRNLKIFGGFLNDDGINPDSSEDILIDGCHIKTVDDAISIKAGRDQDAWNRPGSKNIIVKNCILNSGVNSFCIGSEMSGGVENIFVENCQDIYLANMA